MAKNGKEIIWGGLTAAIAAAAGAQAAGAADAEFTAPVDDWSGLYVGASVGMMDGDAPFDMAGDYQIENDVVFGGFAGINHQMDSVVIGAELALQSGADVDDGDGGNDEYAIDYIADAKFKLGVDVGGSALIYAFGGISGGEVTACCDDDYGFFGVNYGIGAEMMVTEQFSLGAEVLGRTIIEPYDVGGEGNPTHYQGTLRAAFHF